ncbi:DUF4209 domain-containing protein [Oscillatoria amoena NRMC-F 0135]|nr:DUF4209 domain-containing protein [Oscillatoria amoena NRMC-F 0135]
MSVQNILSQYDVLDKKGFDEHIVEASLRSLPTCENIQETDPELFAEIIAFQFYENSTKNDWGTYFGPMVVWNNGDGAATESPSLSLVTENIIKYWEKRGWESINPILTSRYLGLVWDFHYKICNSNPSHTVGIAYIKALLKIANEDYHKREVGVIEKLKRALTLSITFNNPQLINDCKLAIISYDKRHSTDSKPGLWARVYDVLMDNKKIQLTAEEEADLILELENKLARMTSGEKIDTWGADIAAERLATYYKKKNQQDQLYRVLITIKEAYEKTTDDKNSMQVSAGLEHLYKLFTKFNFKNDAEKILLELRTLGPKVAAELKPISVSHDLPQDEIDKYLDHMTSGPLEQVLYKIVAEFIPSKEEAKKQVLQYSKNHPLLYLIGTNQIQDEKGRVIATIGSVEDDLDGHIVQQISKNLSMSSIFLRWVIQEAIKKHNLNVESIIDFISKSPLIEENRLSIIKEGLNAYFNGNFLSAIHLIIPQIEEAIRNLIEITGGVVLKQSRTGGYNLRTFDDILRDKNVYEVFSEDLTNYFITLFTDQRGWNLRNNVCHGLANPNTFDYQTADRVLHALLFIGTLRTKEN